MTTLIAIITTAFVALAGLAVAYLKGGKAKEAKTDLAEAEAEIVAHEEKDKVDEMSADDVVDALSKWVPDDD